MIVTTDEQFLDRFLQYLLNWILYIDPDTTIYFFKIYKNVKYRKCVFLFILRKSMDQFPIV